MVSKSIGYQSIQNSLNIDADEVQVSSLLDVSGATVIGISTSEILADIILPYTSPYVSIGSLSTPVLIGTIGGHSSAIQCAYATVTGTATVQNLAVLSALLLPSGSYLSPSLAFSSDLSTGLYLPSIGHLGLSAGGIEVADISSSLFSLYTPFSCGTQSIISGAITSSGEFSNGTNSMITGQITSSGAFSNGTNSLVSGAITSSGAFSNGTNSMITGQITSSGNFSNGTNSMVTGSLSATSLDILGPITGGSLTVLSLTSTGTISAGTNSCTVGSLFCSSISSSGSFSCGTQSATTGNLTTENINAGTWTITCSTLSSSICKASSGVYTPFCSISPNLTTSTTGFQGTGGGMVQFLSGAVPTATFSSLGLGLAGYSVTASSASFTSCSVSGTSSFTGQITAGNISAATCTFGNCTTQTINTQTYGITTQSCTSTTSFFASTIASSTSAGLDGYCFTSVPATTPMGISCDSKNLYVCAGGTAGTIYVLSALSCQTNSFTAGACSVSSLTNSGTMSAGASTLGVCTVTNLLSNGTISCTTNSLTCGSMFCSTVNSTSIINSGSASIGASMSVVGSISCSSITSTGNIVAPVINASTSFIGGALSISATSQLQATTVASLVSTGTGAVYNGSDLSFYTDAGVTKKGYIGPGYNSDMTIASKTSGNWLRLGADASNIALWCDNNVDVNNSPQYSFSLTSANFNTNSLVCGAISSSTITTTGVFLASNGSAAAPAYAFSGDTATGMYYPSANQLGFSIAGTSRLSINASAVSVTASALNVPAGSAATPGIGFASDTTTGLYSVSSGNIGITFAGVQQFQLNTQGIRAPSGAASQAAYSFTGDTKSGVYSGAVGTVSIGAGGSKICDVSSSGINAGTYGMTCNQLNSSIVINSGTSSFAGVTQFASGSATAPGICFTSSTNTGLSESSGPTLNLVVGGATQCALSGTAFTTNNNVTTPNLLLTNYSASSVFYTSGTWTIQMGDPSFNFTLSSSTGYYVRIAGLVHINLDVKWSSKGSATGNVQISLPFNTSATLFPRPTFSLGYYNGGWPTGTMITAVGTTSAQWIYMYQGGGTNITCSSLSSTGEMQLSGFYSI